MKIANKREEAAIRRLLFFKIKKVYSKHLTWGGGYYNEKKS